MHNIFKYNINEIKNGYKVGFPIQSINKIQERLDMLSINYIIVENNNITYQKEYHDNNYKEYLGKKNYSIIYQRIDKINNVLKNNIDNDIESLLTEIEGLLCMID